MVVQHRDGEIRVIENYCNNLLTDRHVNTNSILMQKNCPDVLAAMNKTRLNIYCYACVITKRTL